MSNPASLARLTVMMNDESTPVVFEKLDRLRTELAELAFTLDRRGRPEAADVAMQISGRVGEIRDEIAAGRAEAETGAEV